MTAAAPPPLSADVLSMMVRGVSVNVAPRDAGLRSGLMRAVGSEVAPDLAANARNRDAFAF